MRVGFTGLGAMGAPMARHLLRRGPAVTVFSRRPESMAPLVDADAMRADTPGDAAARSELTISMVTDTRAVEEVALGVTGVVQGAEPGSIFVDHSTIDPEATRSIGASRMLDLQAPKMIRRDFDGKIESRLHYKDIHIVLDLARALGIDLPASATAAQVLTKLQERGGARQDTSAVFTILANPNS
jgi:3-hydroxyisobutyrate dehydrogenase-like beta-hydroxyacid dehydrogenase